MSLYVTENDPPWAQKMAARWNACSDEAQEFAAWNLGKFPPGTLPHAVAELYDKMKAEGRAREMHAPSFVGRIPTT